MAQPSRFSIVLLGLMLAHGCGQASLEIHVSPEGDDGAAGTLKAPIQSLKRAAELARDRTSNTAAIICLSGGTYRLTEPLRLGPADGGTAEAPVVWKAMRGERVVISGGIEVQGWTQENDGSWSASLPPACKASFRSFYVNGRRATRARFPDEGYLRVGQAGADERTHFFFHAEDIPEIAHTKDLELVLLHDWSITRIPVRSIDWNEHRITAVDSIGARLEFFTLTHWEEHPRYYLENAPEFCDRPGEWFCNLDERKIYYRPLPGEAMDETTGIIPQSDQLLTIEGNPGRHAEYLTFESLTFEHTAWPLPGKGYCGVQAGMHTDRSSTRDGWSQLPAAIQLDRADHCTFDKCILRHTGASGLWIRENCSGNAITESYLYDVGGNGIGIGEGSDRLVEGQPWWKAAPEEVSGNNRVSRSLIEACGQQFYGAVGIWCGLVARTLIEHNEIRELPYTGISVGWMWNPDPTPCRENTIHANHIHHIMHILSDGGGIYSLGLQSGSRITSNLIHDVQVNAGRAESNGMFLDEGTKELLVENNIVYDIARSPLRFHRAAAPNRVRNNVLVCGTNVPPIRYNNTPEEAIELTGNTILDQSSEADMEQLEEILRKWKPD